MVLKGCPVCIKYLLFIFNLIVWIIGLAMIGFGIWVLADSNAQEMLGNNKAASQIRAVVIVIIVTGSIIMITGFLGCCGAIRESQLCLSLFFLVLLIIFLILAVVGLFIMIAMNNDDMKKALKDEIIKGHLDIELERYRDSCVKEINRTNNQEQVTCGMSGKTLLDFYEVNLRCCGVNGSQDYEGKNKEQVEIVAPKACHPVQHISKKGCKEAIYKYLDEQAILIGGILIGVATLTLLAMILGCTLCCSIRSQRSFSTYADD